jgi:hypothetical protein
LKIRFSDLRFENWIFRFFENWLFRFENLIFRFENWIFKISFTIGNKAKNLENWIF